VSLLDASMGKRKSPLKSGLFLIWLPDPDSKSKL